MNLDKWSNRSLTGNVKLGLFLGLFDPITRSHVKAVRSIHSLGLVHCTNVLPFFSNGMDESSLPLHRLEICKRAFANNNDVHVSDFLIENKIRKEEICYLIDRIKADPHLRFQFDYFHIQFSIICGCKLAKYIVEQEGFYNLRRHVTNLILLDYNEEQEEYKQKFDHVVKVSPLMIERKDLQSMLAHDSYHHLFSSIPFGVLDYVYEQNLYKNK